MLLTGRGIGKALDSESLLLGTAAASHHWGCAQSRRFKLKLQKLIGAYDNNHPQVWVKSAKENHLSGRETRKLVELKPESWTRATSPHLNIWQVAYK
ncbi:hypothetical protein ACLKA6_003644 [Drosophila palustris]